MLLSSWSLSGRFAHSSPKSTRKSQEFWRYVSYVSFFRCCELAIVFGHFEFIASVSQRWVCAPNRGYDANAPSRITRLKSHETSFIVNNNFSEQCNAQKIQSQVPNPAVEDSDTLAMLSTGESQVRHGCPASWCERLEMPTTATILPIKNWRTGSMAPNSRLHVVCHFRMCV